MHLVKRILLALLKLLSAKLDALLSPQARILLLNLRQSPLLKRRIGSLEPSLRVPINLAAVLLRQRQRIQGIVDTRSAERRPLLARRTIVQLPKIQSPCFLLCRLGAAAFGFRGLRCFFGGELRVSLGLLARCFGFLGFGVVSVMDRLVSAVDHTYIAQLMLAHFLALLFDPFAHCFSSSALRLESSAAFLPAAASAF